MRTKLWGVLAALALVAAPAVGSAKVLLWEDFTSGRATGQLGARWTLVGEQPGAVTGSVVELDGNAVMRLEGTGTAIVGDPTWGDYTVDVDVNVFNSDYWAWAAGVFFRATGAGTIGTSDAFDFQGRPWGMQVEQWNNGGAWQYLGEEGAHRMVPGQWHHLTVTVTGPRIQAWIDGQPSFDVIDPSGTHLQGAVGMRLWGAGAYFDNLQVSDAQGLPPGYLAIEDFSSGGLDPRWTVHDVDGYGALVAEVIQFEGRNVLSMDDSGMVVMGDPAWTDYTAETEFYVWNDWYSAWMAGLQVRSTSPLGSWSNSAAYDATGRPDAAQLQRNGTNYEWWQWLINAPVPTSSRTWHTVKVVCQGATFRLFMDGELVGVTTDPVPYLSGQVGFVTYGGGAYFTNLVVRENDFAAPVTTAAASGPAGEAGWLKGPATVQLDAVDAGLAGVRELRWSVAGGAETVVAGSSATLALEADGVHDLAFRAVDRDLNAEAAQALTVKVDAAAPVPATPVVSGTPGTNGWYRSPATITLTGTDATSGVRRLHWAVNGGVPSFIYLRSVDVPAGEGTTTVTWTVFDLAGNSAAGTPVTVKVDAVAPVAKVSTSPTSIKANGKLQPVKVTASATDAGSGVASVVVRVTNAAGALVATAAPGATVQLKGTRGERYTFTAVATDLAGNTGSKAVVVPVK